MLSLASFLVLPSCLQNETTIRLNKDGSGQIVEKTILGAQMLAMLDQFSALGGADAPNPVDEMFSEEKAKARAAALGQGVTFEKAEILNADGKKGGIVTYRFADINQLKITPGEGMSDMAPGGAAPAAAEKSQPVTFAYADGKLTIKMPDPAKAGAGEDAPKMPEEASNPEMMEMMKGMLADMEVSFRIVCEDGIDETNATHRDGNTITLSEIKMGELMKEEGAFEKFAKMDQNNPAAAMEALKGVKGVKMEAQKEVSVTLK